MPSDTTADAEQMQLRLLRERSPAQRAALAIRLSADVIRNCKRAVARAHPELAARQIGDRFIELHYGRELAEAVRAAKGDWKMADTSDLVEALRPVLRELKRLGVRHYVGGSIASSMHGSARSTLDVDLGAELDEQSALALIAALQSDYYASQSAVLDAVRRRTCFNLIHLATSFKVDIFVNRGRDFDRRVQERAAVEPLGETETLSAPIATAEDIILIKLEWYRLGNEISQRQWSDVTAVAKLQGGRLDRDYLRRWSRELGLTDLLDRLLCEVDSD